MDHLSHNTQIVCKLSLVGGSLPRTRHKHTPNNFGPKVDENKIKIDCIDLSRCQGVATSDTCHASMKYIAPFLHFMPSGHVCLYCYTH